MTTGSPSTAWAATARVAEQGRRGIAVGLAAVLAVGLVACGTSARADALCPTPEPLSSVLARVAPSVRSFTLANGLRVHLVPRDADRTVSIRVAYDVGARDEPPGRGGVAHLFEHMMFKGSEHVPDGGHFRIVRDVGGHTNATTDYDHTQYWSTVPSEALERVLFAEADRMRSLRLSAANLDNQRAAIREEGLALENVPYVKAATAFGLALWADTPYGHSPIGTPEELAAATPAEAVAFHERYYTPANAVLAIAGGFDPDDARAAVERHFAPIPRGAPRPDRTPAEPDPRPRHAVATDPLAPFPVYAVVWSTVGARSEDALAIAVLDDLLMGHPDARFARQVTRTMTLDAYPLSVSFRDVGLLNYVFAPRTFVGFEEIRDAVGDEVRSLREEGPSPGELCRSLQRERARRLRTLERNEGVAAAIARGALLFDDPRAFETELRRLSGIEPAEIQRIARRHLVPDFHTLEIRPAGAMRWIKPILEALPDFVGASLEEGML